MKYSNHIKTNIRYEARKVDNFIDRSNWWFPGLWGENKGVFFNEDHVGKMKGPRDSCTRCEYVNTTKLYTLKWLIC